MSFFESMAIAGSERIHTQMISWLLTTCTTYSEESKSALICDLFHIERRHFKNIECHTEFKSIDLLVCADDFLGALENKLKASQRADQLSDYWKSLEDAKNKHFPNVTVVKGALLALTDEPPGDLNWSATSYVHFLKTLSALPQSQPSCVDTIIVNEYIATLGRLTAAVAEFCDDHRRFPNVFSDGWKTKHSKSTDPVVLTDTRKYIRSNNMETILQKTFLRSVLADMGIPSGSALIDESRGTAFFEIPLRTVYYRGREFSLGFQLQGKTIKLNIGGRAYQESRPDWIDEPLKTSFKALVAAAGYPGRLNIGRAHAYLSGSQSLTGHFDAFARKELKELLSSHYDRARQAVTEWVPPAT